MPKETTLIGFAGAPWTVATYMIAGQGTPDQGPAHALKAENRAVFEALIDRITDGTIDYLSKQIEAGAEVVKLFDSWAGSLQGTIYEFSVKPMQRIIAALKAKHPDIPIIAFPRGAGKRNIGLHAATGADCIALDDAVDPVWAAANVQDGGCVQGNLEVAPYGHGRRRAGARNPRICKAFANGPHIFNLGHGITPDANPDNVQLMIDTVRGA